MQEEETTYRPRVLCLCPPASTVLPAGLTVYLEATVIDRPGIAVAHARSMIYDCYLAYCSSDAVAALEFWSKVRAIDRNTPFVIVSEAAALESLKDGMRAGFDIYTAPCDPYELVLLIRCLRDSAELRSLHARVEEARVIAEDIRVQLSVIEHRMIAASASLARAETHLMRAHALRTFTEAGGAPAFFERYWFETLDHALQQRDQERL